MEILNVQQNTPEWLAVRGQYFCASDAPAMMGESQYTTRSELLRIKSTGIAPDIDPAKQALFDAGHASEDKARIIIERFIGESLDPKVGVRDGLLASFDGLSEDGETGFEHKLWNEKLAAAVREKNLPHSHYWQLEHQIYVGKLKRVIFVVSDGTPDRMVRMTYKPVPGRMEQLLAGWKQFDEDRANYQHVEVLPAAVAVPVMALPALSIQVTGSIALVDNLKLFGTKLESFISNLDMKPATDQAFADSESAIKTLGAAETALEAAKASALAQTASIDEMVRTVALYAGQARTTRLMLTKLVAARKEAIRGEIVQEAREAFANHVTSLNRRLGKPYMPLVLTDFPGVIKGKKTVASLRDAVSVELARVKIEANEIADRISFNLARLNEAAESYAFLFADVATIVLKAPDDLTALVKVRVAEHKAAEAKRLEAEREKIRAEEAAKLVAENRAMIEAQERADSLSREKAWEAWKARDAQMAMTEQVTAEARERDRRNLEWAEKARQEERAERDQADASQRESDRQQNELLDGRAMLSTFRARFGGRREFSAVIIAIDEYLKGEK